MKNLDCKIEYRVLSTANGSKVHAGACAKTGDIAIKVVEQGGRTAYEWIAFDNLQKPGAKTAGFAEHLISRANASGFDSLRGVAASSPAKLAQAQMEVVCQARRGSNIIRIIKEGDKCYREVVSPMKGGIEKTEEVSCETPLLTNWLRHSRRIGAPPGLFFCPPAAPRKGLHISGYAPLFAACIRPKSRRHATHLFSGNALERDQLPIEACER